MCIYIDICIYIYIHIYVNINIYIYMVGFAVCKFTTENDKSICGSYSTKNCVWVP